MRDKEFDQLFNDKLDGLEMEPSPMVWQNIAAELDGKKSKARAWVPYLGIAASVIVLLSAGLLFFNQRKDEAEDKPKKNDPLVADNRPQGVVKADVGTQIRTTERTAIDAAPRNIARRLAENTTPPAKKAVQQNQAAIESPAQQNTESLIAAVVPKQEATNVQSVVPTIDIPLTPKVLATIEQPDADNKVPMVAANDEMPDKTPVKKRSIRGLGGLINAIVARVDKRDDKLVEFTESDDGGSLLTGVNLGLLKVKKQQ